MAGQGSGTAVAIWDVPIRIFHWAIVLLIPIMWATAELREMEWHRRAGYALLALLVFRLIWGLVGSSTARFAHFLRGPRAILAYTRGRSGSIAIGHNPLGGWSVAAMLLLLALQVGLGLVSTDIDGLESGPLAAYVDFDTGRAAAEWHEALFNLVLVLIALHVAAILFYALVKRRNLVAPMITGVARVENATEAMAPVGRVRLALAVLVAVGSAWLIANA